MACEKLHVRVFTAHRTHVYPLFSSNGAQSSPNILPYDLTNLNPSLPIGVPPLLNVASASSQALPAPNPNPTHAGHALRLNRRTEKTTPKERPMEERIRREDRAWSHLSLSNASLTGFAVRVACVEGVSGGGSSAIV